MSSFSSSASEMETSGFGVLEDEDASVDMVDVGRYGECGSWRRKTPVRSHCHATRQCARLIWCYL